MNGVNYAYSNNNKIHNNEIISVKVIPLAQRNEILVQLTWKI